MKTGSYVNIIDYFNRNMLDFSMYNVVLLHNIMKF